MIKKLLSTVLVFSTLMMAVPALAETTSTPATPKVISPVVLSCVGTAVNARETAIAAAFTAFSSAQTAALSARQNALQAAWTMTTTKTVRTAVNAAWQTYRTAHRTAVKAHTTAVNAAWKQFRTAAKTCRPTSTLPIDHQNSSENSLAQ